MRPIGVWIVSLGFLLAAAADAAVPLLALGLASYYAPDASDELGVNPYLVQLPPLATSLLALLAALALFRLRRAAVALVGVLLVASVLLAAWEMAFAGLLEVLGPIALVEPALRIGRGDW
jgi:glucose dehydrogenase